jgi:hypothetical protein
MSDELRKKVRRNLDAAIFNGYGYFFKDKTEKDILDDMLYEGAVTTEEHVRKDEACRYIREWRKENGYEKSVGGQNE